MGTAQRGLGAAEVEALIRRYLEGEPGVVTQPLRRGHAFLCRQPLADDPGAPWLFAVATDGGVLLRLPGPARERAIANGIGAENIALPDWVVEVAKDAGGRDPDLIHGTPDDWLWVPIPDGTAFERRRPHIHEALEYCTHTRSQGAAS